MYSIFSSFFMTNTVVTNTVKKYFLPSCFLSFFFFFFSISIILRCFRSVVPDLQTVLCLTIFSWTGLYGVVDKYTKIKPVPVPKKKIYL